MAELRKAPEECPQALRDSIPRGGGEEGTVDLSVKVLVLGSSKTLQNRVCVGYYVKRCFR